MIKQRCSWCLSDPIYITYHDEEWGVPIYDEQKLFEFVILEGMQAGLNWLTILKKREAMRTAFHQFNPEKLAAQTDTDLLILQENPSIIRNRLKIASTRRNAHAFLALKEKGIDFSQWLWQFTDGQPIKNTWDSPQQIPVSTAASDAMAKTLKQHHFCFVGTTTCYALMQAAGMVNDHLISCHRHAILS